MSCPLIITPKSILILTGINMKDARIFFNLFVLSLGNGPNYKPCIRELSEKTGWTESSILFHLYATPQDCIDQYSKTQALTKTIEITGKYAGNHSLTVMQANVPEKNKAEQLKSAKNEQYLLFDISEFFKPIIIHCLPSTGISVRKFKYN